MAEYNSGVVGFGWVGDAHSETSKQVNRATVTATAFESRRLRRHPPGARRAPAELDEFPVS